MYCYLSDPSSEVNEHLAHFLLPQRFKGHVASIFIIREDARNNNHSSTIAKSAQDEKDYQYMLVQCTCWQRGVGCMKLNASSTMC